MNYLQWTTKKESELRSRVCFMVSGTERALVNRITDEILAKLMADDFELVRMPGGSKVCDIDTALGQYSIGRRVVVVESLQQTKKREFITRWLDSVHGERNRDVILVATADSIRSGKGEDRFIPTHKAVCYIDCNKFTGDSLQSFASSVLRLDDEAAGCLVDRCGSVDMVLNELSKLALFDDIDVSMVKELVPRRPTDNLVDAIIDSNAREALSVHLDENGFRLLIGSLAHRLVQISHLVLLRSKRLNVKELIDRTGIQPFLIGKALDQANGTSWNMIERRFALLFDIDVQARRGNTAGLLEVLVARWS